MRCVAERKNVEIISADRKAGEVDAADGEMRIVAEIFGQQRLLNVARDADFLFHALAFALAFDEARVVENAGGVGGERVENLAIEFRERSGAARIEIEHAEKIAALDIDHRLIGVGARHGIERNDDDGAKSLRDDALRGLQIHVGLREVFGDHRGLAAQRELNCGLARRQAFGRETQTAGAPRQPHFERFVVVGFEEQPAVGVGDRNGVIEHVAENGVERQLRMQQRRRFQQTDSVCEVRRRLVRSW